MLYGFVPEKVQKTSHQPTVGVLNAHAGVIASKHKTGSDRFCTLFAKFVRRFKESDCDEGYLDGNAKDVTRAYRAFLNCIKSEFTSVEAVATNNETIFFLFFSFSLWRCWQ
ncbi:hypothetical protein BDZ91DRAFT_734939 [Kalaharituber pfeilii]|nr:hypothetical protein BDZ91DRAFT_734939 [Kalaharituber pfeilii]